MSETHLIGQESKPITASDPAIHSEKQVLMPRGATSQENINVSSQFYFILLNLSRSAWPKGINLINLIKIMNQSTPRQRKKKPVFDGISTQNIIHHKRR